MSMSIAAATPMPASCPHTTGGGDAATTDPAAMPPGDAGAGAAALGGGDSMSAITSALAQLTQAVDALVSAMGGQAVPAATGASATDPTTGGGPAGSLADALTKRLDATVTTTPEQQQQVDALRTQIDGLRSEAEQTGMENPATAASIRSQLLRVMASPEDAPKLDQLDADISALQAEAETTGSFNPGATLSIELRLRAVEQNGEGFDPAAFQTVLDAADALASEQGPVDPARIAQLTEQRDAAFGGSTPDFLI